MDDVIIYRNDACNLVKSVICLNYTMQTEPGNIEDKL